MREDRNAFYRNPAALFAVILLVLIVLFCIIYPYLSPYSPYTIDVYNLHTVPNAAHPLGTDRLGRDMLTRLATGGRVTLSVAFRAGLMAAVVGTLAGIAAGYCGGTADAVIMRGADALSSVPSLLLAIVTDFLLGWGHGKFVYGLALAGIPTFTKLIRGATLEVRGSEFIEASRALGGSSLHVIRRHILRNIMPTFAVQISNAFSEALTTCTILGYMSVGINPPTAEWGAMFDSAKDYIRTIPYLPLIPTAAIVLTIVCLQLISNGIRDSLKVKGSAGL